MTARARNWRPPAIRPRLPTCFASLIVGRTQGDPFLNFKVPPDVHEITVAVEDLAQRGGNDFGYRLTVRKQAEDFLLSASPAYMNVPRGGNRADRSCCGTPGV